MTPVIGVCIIGVVVGVSALWLSLELDDVHDHLLKVQRTLRDMAALAEADHHITDISHQTQHQMLDVTLRALTKDGNA
ncbi:MAG: hypothetical protein ACYDCC_12175 [Actinomycetota bacterium]